MGGGEAHRICNLEDDGSSVQLLFFLDDYSWTCVLKSFVFHRNHVEELMVGHLRRNYYSLDIHGNFGLVIQERKSFLKFQNLISSVGTRKGQCSFSYISFLLYYLCLSFMSENLLLSDIKISYLLKCISLDINMKNAHLLYALRIACQLDFKSSIITFVKEDNIVLYTQ